MKSTLLDQLDIDVNNKVIEIYSTGGNGEKEFAIQIVTNMLMNNDTLQIHYINTTMNINMTRIQSSLMKQMQSEEQLHDCYQRIKFYECKDLNYVLTTLKLLSITIEHSSEDKQMVILIDSFDMFRINNLQLLQSVYNEIKIIMSYGKNVTVLYIRIDPLWASKMKELINSNIKTYGYYSDLGSPLNDLRNTQLSLVVECVIEGNNVQQCIRIKDSTKAIPFKCSNNDFIIDNHV